MPDPKDSASTTFTSPHGRSSATASYDLSMLCPCTACWSREGARRAPKPTTSTASSTERSSTAATTSVFIIRAFEGVTFASRNLANFTARVGYAHQVLQAQREPDPDGDRAGLHVRVPAEGRRRWRVR